MLLNTSPIYFCSRAKIVYFHCHKFWWSSWSAHKSSGLIPLALCIWVAPRMASVVIAFPISSIDYIASGPWLCGETRGRRRLMRQLSVNFLKLLIMRGGAHKVSHSVLLGPRKGPNDAMCLFDKQNIVAIETF